MGSTENNKKQQLVERTPQTKYQECYVAFLDILGFKDLINTQNFEKILEIFKAVSGDSVTSEYGFKLAFCKATDDEPDENGQYNNTLLKANVYAMSDSIVVSVPCASPYSLEVLIDVCLFLQVRLYEFDGPVLLRGAVAKGMYFCDKSVAFGKGMVDAYLYQENYSIYPRIILSQNLIDELSFVGYKGIKVVQDQRDSYWYIDCMSDYLSESKEDDAKCQKFRQMINEYINGYYSAQIREKYFWLDREYKRIVLKQVSLEGATFCSENDDCQHMLLSLA